MDNLNARPNLLKQANMTSIRKVIREKFTATRAEIAAETFISSTTVRALLTEMMANGEIESIGFDESSGGRKAERYRFCPDRYYGAAFCRTKEGLVCLLTTVCGEIASTERIKASEETFEQAVTEYLDQLVLTKEIKAIGIGVSGVVEGGGYWRKSPVGGKLYRTDIGDQLAARYHIPVVLENNINATAFGFAKRYEAESGNDAACDDIAYLKFDRTCIKAGFLSGGRMIRGGNNFAGELGLIPIDGIPLDEMLSLPLNDTSYAELLAKIFGWIAGVLNPDLIALGGADLRPHCVDSAAELLSALLPERMMPKILRSTDSVRDFCEGMARLTADKMFDDILIVKE